MTAAVESRQAKVYHVHMAKRSPKPEKAPEPTLPDWSERLRTLRKKTLQLTQEQMATKLGFTRRSIITWEKGEAPIPEAVKRIISLLEKHPEARPDF